MEEAIITSMVLTVLVYLLILLLLHERDKAVEKKEIERKVTDYITSANEVNVLYKTYNSDLMTDVYKIGLAGIGLLAYVDLVDGSPSLSTICSYRFHANEDINADLKLPAKMYNKLQPYVQEYENS